MYLPDRESAYIPSTKLSNYLLSLSHPAGRSKARFLLAVGYRPENPEILEQDLLSIAHTVEVAGMPVTDRIEARRRMVSGTHIPHPNITVRRVRAAQFEFERPTNIHLDGRLTTSARALSVRVEPDAIDLWV